MTTDNAIAVLRRMQEPDPFEPQITQTAFDALEMAIDMIERYSTWSQTYSNMVEDAISRKAAVDVIHKYFAERIEQSPTHMTKDGEVYDLGICNPLLADNKALSQAIKELPFVQLTQTNADSTQDCISRQMALEAFNDNIDLPNDERVMKSVESYLQRIYDKIKSLPSAQPEIVRCGQCKHYYFADNRIPQEQRYTCELDGDRWKADDFCSYAEREE